MSAGSSIPPDLHVITYLLSSLRKEQESTNVVLRDMSGTLRSINTEITYIKEDKRKQDVRIKELEDKHNNCKAGQAVIGLNARVKRLEKYDREGLKAKVEEVTGSMDTDAQRAEAIAMAELARQHTDRWAILFTPKVILTVVLATVIGIALGAVVIANAFGIVPLP